MRSVDPELDDLHRAWADAVRDGDVERAIELLTPDYVLWASGARPLTGREDVRWLLTAAFAASRVEPVFEAEERLVSGDLAVERGWDVQTVRPRGGGPASTRRQRVFLVLRRGEDGRWRFARGMSQPGPDQG